MSNPLPTLQSVFSADQISTLHEWITTQISVQAVNLIDTTNTGTGTSSCTINGVSGIATFTDTIAAGVVTAFTITNNLVTTSSVIRVGLKYGAVGAGSPVILSYSVTTGSFNVLIKNIHATTATNANLTVEFQFS